ncbi:MAG: CoA-binding protein [candidate division KSB1 bacterium]|nr:CoA-binding protein [candidate division KSB1 bacterium]
MKSQMTKPFPYYVGIYSLEELVTRDSRVCVINILGNESRKVTPVSHTYSGGNVVAGVQYGRLGRLETDKGNIPVFRSVLDVVKNQIPFDIGVIYLPPAAVSQAAWELVTYNKALKRIIIITEKVPTRDSRNIRFICQEAGVDVVGANCLGVANVWDHVRVGGALGGDHPDESLVKGSVALHSNSGNFTTTISEYLKTGGFGISTAVSSGKDVYIHFALPEFLYAAQNDPRTKAVALYVEPGGYYEKQAIEWIRSRRFGFNKPIVVCVTGRWKKYILRACGHAGAMAGGGDDAESKERWFDEYFDCDVFDPDNPVVGKKGVRISSIQHFPDAMKAVYKKIDEPLDFKSTGDLSLKLWVSDNLLKLPPNLDMPVTRAMSPYGEQIEEITKQVGATCLTQNMRNKSAASRINPKTLVAELHGTPVLDLSTRTVEDNLFFALAKVQPASRDIRKVNFLLNAFLKLDDGEIGQINIAKARGCTPNAYLGSQIAMLGDAPLLKAVREKVIWIIDTLREFGWASEMPEPLRKKIIRELLTAQEEAPGNFTDHLLKEVGHSDKKRPPLLFCRQVLTIAASEKKFIKDRDAFLMASILTCLFWNPMLGKRISRRDVEDAVVYFFIVARLVAFSVIDPEKNKMWKKLALAKEFHPTTSFTENVFKILLNRKPTETELTELKMLLGLTITNGPGTLSAKGAKESVSARNHISLAFTGFLCNTGLAHGGNGFEAVDYLMQQFKKAGLGDPGDLNSGINLTALANKAAKAYRSYKIEQKEMGHLNYKRIPCINHPVFKGNQVNIDPREDYIRKQIEKMGIRNIFLDFYHELVKELHNEGVTNNVFCVNVDAVLAVITLKLIWHDLKSRRISMHQAQDLVFILFLIGRAIGVAAEIADHRNRGQDMDCRTPQSELTFVL